jgi:hypothetical protein
MLIHPRSRSLGKASYLQGQHKDIQYRAIPYRAPLSILHILRRHQRHYVALGRAPSGNVGEMNSNRRVRKIS